MKRLFKPQFYQLIEGHMRLVISELHPGNREMIPFYYWDILVDDEFVGRICLRVGYNYHSYYNGNVGYEIAPRYRGHGYAAAACRMILPVARAHGMDYLILSCAESNVASAKTIERIGGRYLETVAVPADYFAYYEGIEDRRIYKLPLDLRERNTQ